MSEHWKQFLQRLQSPETVWQDQWDAKLLRHMNENVWISQNLIERMLNGETERDFEAWEDEL